VQGAFGVSRLVFLVLAGAFLVGEGGLIAGVLLAVYPPAIYFDGLVQRQRSTTS